MARRIVECECGETAAIDENEDLFKMPGFGFIEPTCEIFGAELGTTGFTQVPTYICMECKAIVTSYVLDDDDNN